VTEVGARTSAFGDHGSARPTYKPAMPAREAKGRLLGAAMETAMRKAEPVDEYAETEVLTYSDGLPDLDADPLSAYAEYERQLADEVGQRHYSRARR
jgi:hypothetical protein